jgi:hypothetical protein
MDAPGQGHSGTGQITRYKNRTDHELTTRDPAVLILTEPVTFPVILRLDRRISQCPSGKKYVLIQGGAGFD